jgi:hypothetical protein
MENDIKTILEKLTGLETNVSDIRGTLRNVEQKVHGVEQKVSNSNFGFAGDLRLLMETDFAEGGGPCSHQETAMPRPLSFDHLQAILRQHTAGLPDVRKPSPNTRYTIQNAA